MKITSRRWGWIFWGVMGIASCSGAVGDTSTLPLWADVAPLGDGTRGRLEGRASSAAVWREAMPIGDGTPKVVYPQITVFPPARPNGAAVVICVGGGYMRLVLPHEGPRVARWLADHGILGVVLEYRMPRGSPRVPLADAQRAIRLVRSRAREWRIDPARVGIMGFSAGGHLASTAGTHFDAGNPEAPDPVDRFGSRPDFMLLIYPVITLGEKTHAMTRRNFLGAQPADELVTRYSNERQVTPQTPPAFLAHAADDKSVPPENSRRFAAALRAAGVAAEYLELPYGGHGLAPELMWEAWKAGALAWLQAQRIVPAGPPE